MKVSFSSIVLIITLIVAGCTEKFTPEIHGANYQIVVNGLITDQPEVYTIRLSWSIPYGEKSVEPMSEADVRVQDDLGNVYQFMESSTPGIYVSDKATFRGVVGRKYTLHINTLNATPTHYSYESVPVEMKAVPPVDSLYFERVLIAEAKPWAGAREGCQIYLNTNDPNLDCKYFRWDYTETWKLEIPYYVTNRICWISNSSQNIDVKNTSILSESIVNRHPVVFITNETDRLLERYSIIVNQYSISENEFAYWERVRNVWQDVGSLWDVIPASIPGNMFCIEDPDETVLGYFSVSARTSKRIYIDEGFSGVLSPYRNCESKDMSERWPIGAIIPGLNVYRWIIIEDPYRGYVITTFDHQCADCTVRGTSTRPEFWSDYK